MAPMNLLTLHQKFKALTQYDDYAVDLILGIEIADGGLHGAVAYVDRVADYMRMHKLAESLESVGHDPMDALERLYDAYASGGVTRMENMAVKMRASR